MLISFDEEEREGEPLLGVRSLPQVRGGGGLWGVRPPDSGGGRAVGATGQRVPVGDPEGFPLSRWLRQRVQGGAPQDPWHLPHPQCKSISNHYSSWKI